MKIDTTQALQNLNSSKIKIDPNSDDAKLKKQTDNFEALILKEILDISLKSENSLFGKDAGDKIYHSMYNDALSKAMSGSFGYSQLLFNYLKQNR
jgi:Rod binding domain-containing protein